MYNTYCVNETEQIPMFIRDENVTCFSAKDLKESERERERERE